MRFTGFSVLLSAAVLLATAPAALADKEIEAQSGNRFAATSVTMDQGEKLTFRNSDPFVRHDVVSEQQGSVRGQYLFASDTIGQGTSFVEGSQYLTTGSYNFYCSLHPSQMKGTLNVTAAGTPVPRPGSGGTTQPGGGTTGDPETDVVGPELSLRTPRPRARALRRSREIPVTVGVDEAAKVVLKIRLGKRLAATRTIDFSSAGKQKVLIRLSRKALRRIRRGTKLSVRASATDRAGNPGTALWSVKLR
jgi:plastocyanin